MPVIDLITDPLCSWCYAAAPLAKLAAQDFRIRLHQGGLMTGARQRFVDAQMRDFLLEHSRHVTQLSAQPFGAAFEDGLLNDPQYWMSSELPSAAIYACIALKNNGLDMLDAIQVGYYQNGKAPSEREHLCAYARQLGVDEADFNRELDAQMLLLDQHFTESRALLSQAGAAGFPSFILNRADGSRILLEHQHFYANPSNWRAYLQSCL